MAVKIREKEKGSGVYWCFIHHRGRRLSIKAGSLKAAQVAKEYYDAKLLTDPDSLFAPKARVAPTVREMSKRWLADAKYRQSTRVRYQTLLDPWVLPAIGSKKVDEVSRADVKGIINAAQKTGLSRSTLELILTTISCTLREAVDEGYIETIPTADVLRKVKGSRKPPNPFTREEWFAFIAAADKVAGEKWALALRFMFYTGCRLGELIALEWADIDWAAKKVSFNKSFRLELSGTKTGAHRSVDMPEELIAMLKQYRKRVLSEVLEDRSERPALVFPKNGGHCPQNSFRNLFKRVQKAAGQTGRHPHDIRHTTASMLLSMGANVMYVAKHLGHTSTKMTLDVYGQWLPQSGPAPVNLLTFSAPNTHSEKKNAAEAASFLNLVAMQGFEPRTLRI